MSYTDNQLKIVKWLDAPPKFAFWDMDVALIMVAFSTLGMILGHTLFLTALGLFVTYFYSKFKTGKHHDCSDCQITHFAFLSSKCKQAYSLDKV